MQIEINGNTITIDFSGDAVAKSIDLTNPNFGDSLRKAILSFCEGVYTPNVGQQEATHEGK